MKETLSSEQPDELTRLRRRVSNQRAELRRMNRGLEYFWRGWHYSFRVRREIDYRNKMIKAFGREAVENAER